MWIFIKIEIFRTSTPKLRFPKIYDQNRCFCNFWPKSRYFDNFDFNQEFSKILTRIAIVGYLEQNRDVSNKIEIYRRFWPNLKFSPILTKIAIFRRFCPKLRFSKISTKTDLFRKASPKSILLKILTKIAIFSKICWQVWHQLRFFENLTQIERIQTNSRFFEDFGQTWNFHQ